MKININFILVFLIFYLLGGLFFSKKNIFEYLELKKVYEKNTFELSKVNEKKEKIENDILMLKNKEEDFVEEILKEKFNLKLKSEYVIYFQEKK